MREHAAYLVVSGGARDRKLMPASRVTSADSASVISLVPRCVVRRHGIARPNGRVGAGSAGRRQFETIQLGLPTGIPLGAPTGAKTRGNRPRGVPV